MKTLFLIFRVFILLIILASCTPANSPSSSTPLPTPTHVAESTPTFEGISDCLWSGIGFVWIDQNGDGEYQEGEQPIPDVPVLIDDTLNDYTDVGGKAKTSLGGVADLSVWLPGCPDVEFEIYIQVPDGYVLTTPARVRVDGYDDRSSFGLTYLPGVSTATPLPPAPVCKLLPFPRNRKIVDFSISDDGAIWVGTESNGVYHQLAGQEKWTQWDSRQYLITDNVWAVNAGYGHVWVASPRGVSFFDGETWHSYTEADGLISNKVYDVAIEKDGSAWFATNKGVSYFSITDKSWKSFTKIPGLGEASTDAVEVASDGTVWFIADLFTVMRLVWPDHGVEPEWEIYTRFYNKTDAPIQFLSVTDIAADAFGNVWFAGLEGFTRFNVIEDTWFPKYFDTDIYYLEKEFWFVATDTDGSAWLVDQSRVYHYFPAGIRTDKDVMLEYSTGGTIPDIHSLISIQVGPDGRVWLIMERQIYACEFFE